MASGFGLPAVGCCQSGGFFGFGFKCPLSMPNKSVKGTARRSGCESIPPPDTL